MPAAATDTKTLAADRAYVARTMAAPYLTAATEEDLARRWAQDGDQAALHALVEAHGRLAQAIARRFKHYGLPIGDLVQEGNIGLLQAAQKFDPDRGVRFSTYAAWWIRAAIQDYVLRNWSIVRTGTTSAQKSLFFNFRRLRAQIEAAGDGAPLNDNGRAEIAEALGVRVADVAGMEGRLAAGDRSLDTPMGAGADGEVGDTWLARMADERPTPEDEAAERSVARLRGRCLSRALAQLPEREREIVRARHLAEDEDALTLEVLGRRLGVSKERVRQLEARAMDKLAALVRACAGGDGRAVLA